jgi:hypothetical protein
MKSFFQYITEALTASDIAIAKKNMARIAKQVMAKQAKRGGPINRGIAWNTDTGKGGLHAWWHASKKPVVFSWSPENYHITQVFKNPAAFGLTREVLIDMLFDELIKNLLPGADEQRVKAKVMSDYLRYERGEMDYNKPIEKFLMSKGWVKVSKTYSKSTSYRNIGLLGNLSDVKKCVREIIQWDIPEFSISAMDPEGRLLTTMGGLKTERDKEAFAS